MRYLIPIMFLVLPVLAFAAGHDAGTADAAADTAAYGGPVTDWNEWVRSSPLGQILTGAFVSVLMLGITKVRGEITDRSGTLGVALLALFGGVSSSVVGGTPLDPKLVEVTVAVLLTAIGGYTFIKKLVFPSDGGSQKGQGTASGELTAKDSVDDSPDVIGGARYRKPSEPPPLPPPPKPPEVA